VSKTPLLIDKSFIQGSKTSDILTLAETHDLLMTDALFYELMTSDPISRARVFSKLPATENPVKMVPHFGEMLKKEIHGGIASGKPSENSESFRFQFNAGLADPDYEYPDYVQDVIEEQKEELALDVEGYLRLVETIPTIFPTLLIGNDAIRAETKAHIEREIASDIDGIRDLLASLEPPIGAPSLPPSEVLTIEWALVRWTQVRLLFALDTYVRYKGNIPSHLSSKMYDRFEHDVHDAHYLTLSVLEGTFATREVKLQTWFQLLCPDGLLRT
jgi:hypothetical protein